MKQTLIVIKETYLRHVKSWSFVFMVLSPFIFIGLSFGVGYLSSMSSSNSSRLDSFPVLPFLHEFSNFSCFLSSFP